MPPVDQGALRELWLGGQDGRFCTWEFAKAVSLRAAYEELHGEVVVGCVVGSALGTVRAIVGSVVGTVVFL